MRSYSFEVDLPAAVRDFLAAKALRPSASYLDFAPAEHANIFTVAKATELEVVRTIRDALQKSLEDGVPFAQFKEGLEPRLKALGWWGTEDVLDPLTGKVGPARLGSSRRLRTIFESNMRSARAAGQWERIQRNKEALPFLIYTLGPSEVHRPLHADKEGLILPVDDPFWREWYFPNGWGCKCGVRQISEREAKARGYRGDPAPKIRKVPFRNPRTGEVRLVPEGIDPAWAGNPGLDRMRRAQDYVTGTYSRVPQYLAEIALRDLARDREFRAFVGGERGEMRGQGFVPIARMPESITQSQGITLKTAILTASDAAAHNITRGNIGKYVDPSVFSQLSSALRTGDVNWDEARQSYLINFQVDGVWHFAAIGYSAQNNRLYLKTLFRKGSRRRNLRGEVIRRAEDPPFEINSE